MSEQPGWDAIDGALRPLYGDIEPFHWAPDHPWSLGGPDPLDGISAYSRTEPVPHWHYVCYGMTELYEKEWDDPEESGWGFEFTFRLVRKADETEPPVWPTNFLQNLARYVFQSGKWFEPGHTIKANGPIATGRAECTIHAVCFAVDPELGGIDTPHGRVRFLQIVGLTMPEYHAAQGGHALELLTRLDPHLPLYVTDIHRDPLVSEPKPQARWPRWGGGLRGRV
ncbi:suppressor of fused domain protein [Nocardia sp. NBC_01730]|uniref:suppressor of fused domain protein n=1 Tax=Nocardia sp. NBC_01730 TaxID=2975998 RepID=UPI002E0FB39C|nr:suppressor of fused domain protein [Nocardia sp. NBC_01730]